MIGNILLIVLGVVLLAILVILLLPISVRVNYEAGTFRFWLRYAGKVILQHPAHPTGREKEKKTKPDEAATESSPEPKKKPKVNWEQISYSLDVLPRLIVKSLSRTAGCIQIRPLKIHVLVAGPDPADTAVLYGKLHGVLAAVMPSLHRAVRIKDQDIQLFPDFCEERMDFIVDLGFRIRIWDLLVVAVSAMFGVLKWYLGFRKRRTRESNETNKKTKGSARADDAA